MGQIVIAAAGAAAGYFAGPALGLAALTGAQLGWMGGSMLGAAMQGPTKVQGPQQSIMDLKITGTEYGQCIPYVRGAARIAGQMWWNTDRRPTTTTTTETSGGKGGGGTETTTSTTTYDMDCLIGLTDNEIVGVARIWIDGKLIWTSSSGATAGSIAASEASNAWDDVIIYTGSATQLPDPTYEAAVGAANAIAYRGRSYAMVKGLKLGPSGQVKNLTFEVVADGGLTPDAPTIGAGTGGIAQVSVTFTPPADDGGLTITGYTVTATATGTTTPVVSTGTGATSPIVVSGLANGTTYDFTVHATNAAGNSPESGIATATTKTQVFATFDPAMNGGFTLTEANLVASITGAGGAGKCVFANQYKSSGKWRGQFTCEAAGALNIEVGLVNSLQSLSNYIGATNDGYGFISDARKIHAGAAAAYDGTWSVGDVLDIYWNADDKTLTFAKNGASPGVAYTSAVPGLGTGEWTFAVQAVGAPVTRFAASFTSFAYVLAGYEAYEGMYVWV